MAQQSHPATPTGLLNTSRGSCLVQFAQDTCWEASCPCEAQQEEDASCRGSGGTGALHAHYLHSVQQLLRACCPSPRAWGEGCSP